MNTASGRIPSVKFYQFPEIFAFWNYDQFLRISWYFLQTNWHILRIFCRVRSLKFTIFFPRPIDYFRNFSRERWTNIALLSAAYWRIRRNFVSNPFPPPKKKAFGSENYKKSVMNTEMKIYNGKMSGISTKSQFRQSFAEKITTLSNDRGKKWILSKEGAKTANSFHEPSKKIKFRQGVVEKSEIWLRINMIFTKRLWKNTNFVKGP